MQNTSKKFLISVAPLTRIALTRDQSFFYTFSRPLPIGTHVEIPIGKRKVDGIVTESTKDFPRESNFEIKRISVVVEEKFLTTQQLKLALFISEYYICPLGIVLKHFMPKRMSMRNKTIYKKSVPQNISLNTAQQKVVSNIMRHADHHQNFFLHVLHQSDKISILFSLIREMQERRKNSQTLYLLPELLQTPYFTKFFQSFFNPEEIAIVHSKLPKGEFYKKWEEIRSGKVKVIVGTRIALFAPFFSLNTIIVDEAHDISHKQWDSNPRYDVRTVSDELARLHNCPQILTSATPRTVDYAHHIHKTSTQFISYLSQKLPPIDVIDMKKERWDKNKSPLSRSLVAHVRSTLKNKKQALLFVNRQGNSAFSVCTKCRSVLRCPTCDRALISTKKNEHVCIQCHNTIHSTQKCKKCKAPIEHVGIGTTRIRNELSKIFSHAKIAIADTSTMTASDSHKKIFDAFNAKEIDIIIGTQMITKSWHTANVGLCAIIDMDHLLSLPDYNTNEKAFAFVIQMALRTQYGKLIVQTFQPENPVVAHAQKYAFDDFYRDELGLRKILKYPPYAQTIKIIYQDATKKIVEEKVAEMHKKFIGIYNGSKEVLISEPHFPLVDKVRSKYRKQITIKITTPKALTNLSLMLRSQDPKWIIDIDPVQLI